jgi:hypothetical protein
LETNMNDALRRRAREIAQSYLDVWSHHSHEDRTSALLGILDEDCRYTDPDDDVTGVPAVASVIDRVTSRLPDGYRFELTDPLMAHHDQIYFGWQLLSPDEVLLASGRDVLTTVQSPDGARISRVTGFFD